MSHSKDDLLNVAVRCLLDGNVQQWNQTLGTLKGKPLGCPWRE